MKLNEAWHKTLLELNDVKMVQNYTLRNNVKRFFLKVQNKTQNIIFRGRWGD
jgi:hypothetical protein